MTMETVDNGFTAMADFPFYKGEVGVRDKGERREIAYFGTPPDKAPVEGKLNGERVRVTAIHSRDLSQAKVTLGRPNAMRVVTLTIVPR